MLVKYGLIIGQGIIQSLFSRPGNIKGSRQNSFKGILDYFYNIKLSLNTTCLKVFLFKTCIDIMLHIISLANELPSTCISKPCPVNKTR